MLPIEKIPLNSPQYPLKLKSIDSPPKNIFIMGSLSLKKSVAIVGTRGMTEYGKRVTMNFASELARNGVVIISGLAKGIDTVAHTSSLKAGGLTIAVLGNGLDIIYPRENEKLAQAIAKKGALVTEYDLGTKPLPKNFLARNRIISALSDAMLIVEGRQRSGTLSTATHAANQGKEVFAVPGPIDSQESQAPNYLIENGARVARSPKDILEYLDTLS